MIELLAIVTLFASFAFLLIPTCAKRAKTAPAATKSMKAGNKSLKTAIGDPTEVTACGTPPGTPPNKGKPKDPAKPPIKQVSKGGAEPAKPAGAPSSGAPDVPKPNGSKDAKSGSVVPGQDGVGDDGKPKIEKTVMLTLRQRKGDKSKEVDDHEETGGEAIDAAKPSEKERALHHKSGKNKSAAVVKASTPAKSPDNTDAKKKKDEPSKPILPPGMSNKDDATQKNGSKEEVKSKGAAPSNVSADKKDAEPAPAEGTAAGTPAKKPDSKSKESKSKEDKAPEKDAEASKGADKSKDKDKDKDKDDKKEKPSKKEDKEKEEKSKTKTEEKA